MVRMKNGMGILIEYDFVSYGVLLVAYATVYEVVPLELELAEDFLESFDFSHGLISLPRHLQVVDVIGHQGTENSAPVLLNVLHTELVIYRAGLQPAYFPL